MNPMLLILSKAWRLVMIEDDLSECMVPLREDVMRRVKCQTHVWVA